MHLMKFWRSSCLGQQAGSVGLWELRITSSLVAFGIYWIQWFFFEFFFDLLPDMPAYMNMSSTVRVFCLPKLPPVRHNVKLLSATYFEGWNGEGGKKKNMKDQGAIDVHWAVNRYKILSLLWADPITWLTDIHTIHGPIFKYINPPPCWRLRQLLWIVT